MQKKEQGLVETDTLAFYFKLSAKTCRAYNSGVVTERSGYDFCLFRISSCVLVACNNLNQRLGEIFLFVAHATAYAEHVGLEYVNHIRDTLGKITDILVAYLLSVGVTLLHSGECDSCRYATVWSFLAVHQGFDTLKLELGHFLLGHF